MSQVHLQSLNLENADLDIKFVSNSDNEPEDWCAQDHKSILMKVSNLSMEFTFNHWLETEAHNTEEEWGVGSFSI